MTYSECRLASNARYSDDTDKQSSATNEIRRTINCFGREISPVGHTCSIHSHSRSLARLYSPVCRRMRTNSCFQVSRTSSSPYAAATAAVKCTRKDDFAYGSCRDEKPRKMMMRREKTKNEINADDVIRKSAMIDRHMDFSYLLRAQRSVA